MFISVIVPAFNVELFIERCINSICNQNFSPYLFEVIIVNDGSTDNTLIRIQRLIAQYQNHKIILVDKPNGGLSSARNAGLSKATGKYVWFVDSDDYIALNSLESICNDINKHSDLDMLAFNMEYIYDDGMSDCNKRILPPEEYITGSELYFMDFRYPYSAVQFAIYKRSYLQSAGLRFKEGILFEDILYTTLLLAGNPKCVFVNKTYYQYYIRTGSITHSKSSIKKCLDILSVSDEFYDIIKYNRNYNIKVLYDQIARLLPSIYRYHIHGLTLKEKRTVIKEVNRRSYWSKAIITCEKYKYVPYLFLNFLLKPFTSF